MLAFDDPLPIRPRRVLVAGVSGAGKTTLARQIASVIDAPHTEIDGLYHGPNWVPRDAFLDDVRTLVQAPTWVTEWQYRAARPTLTAHADLLVWLDLPFFRVTLPRVVRRTVRRRMRREELWNGNVEPPLRSILTERDHIVRWAVRTRKKYDALPVRLADERPDLAIVRLRTPREVRAWVAGPLARV
ncbi:AAA family ATPase [Microbacterium aurantiacum]|uniref:AAA family ATPase n=1 Tax=Microbacterium aurantiacum TaxID=162393 RepID=UPI001F25B7FA|nr:AAA family ATPase [Microbacterium aurantiacum]